MFGGDSRRLLPQRLCDKGGVQDNVLIAVKSPVRLLEHDVVNLGALFHVAGNFGIKDVLVFEDFQPDNVSPQEFPALDFMDLFRGLGLPGAGETAGDK